MINVRFAALPIRWEQYELHLYNALAEVGLTDVTLSTDTPPEDTDYVIYAPNSDVQDFAPYTRCKAVLSLWAGVESIVGNHTLTQPLCRMVDPSLTQGMVEWVTGHVLRHHLGMDTHIKETGTTWDPITPPVAWERKIAVLGLGQLGHACAQSLSAIGFDTHGWARSEKEIAGVTCQTDIKAAMKGADGVVLLLPDTSATENALNSDTLAYLKPGAFVVNPGRGPLIDDDALIAALDSGQIGHATLDVFRIEPLPDSHPFWKHPRITVTPHIAAETRPKWASKTIAENIRRGENGEPFLHLVDRALGY